MHLTLSEPLSGLAPLTRYDLSPLEGAAGVYTLRSVDRPEIRLFLLDPSLYVPDFHPELPPLPETSQVLVVVTPGSAGTTVNLLAPVIVDPEARSGRQIVLADDIDRVRTPLTPVP